MARSLHGGGGGFLFALRPGRLRTAAIESDDPLVFVISHNLHRRHDSENERAMVGARMANLRQGGERGNQYTGGKKPTGDLPAITIERAAELSGSSKKNIQRAKPIVQSGIPESSAA